MHYSNRVLIKFFNDFLRHLIQNYKKLFKRVGFCFNLIIFVYRILERESTKFRIF